MDSEIFIIESPAPIDLLEGDREGETVGKILDLAEIANSYHLVVNRDCLEKAIEGICDSVEAHPCNPILHISAHGTELGIVLTSGEFIDWSDFRDLIEPLSKKHGRSLIICFSTCFGAEGWKIALSLGHTFAYAVGPVREVNWDEASIAYSCFYYLLLNRGISVRDACLRMNIAIGLGDKEILFRAVTGEAIAKPYRAGFFAKLIADKNIKAIKKALAEMTKAAS